MLLSTAQRIVDLGLRDLGYQYVVQDDCWSAGRNASGYLQPNTTLFPHGMSYVSEKLHDMGFGFGIYSDAGSLTCGRFAGSLGYEEADAQVWASWGVRHSLDYLSKCIIV